MTLTKNSFALSIPEELKKDICEGECLLDVQYSYSPYTGFVKSVELKYHGKTFQKYLKPDCYDIKDWYEEVSREIK